MNNFRQFTKHLGIIGILQLLIKFRALFVLPLITKVLGTQEYGLWAQFTVTLEFMFPILSLGLTGALTRYLASVVDKIKIKEIFYSIFFVVFATGLIGGLLIYVSSEYLAESFFNGSRAIVQILSVVIVVHCLNIVLLSYLRTFKQTMKYSVFFLAESYGGLIVIYYLVLHENGIFEILLSLMILKFVKLLALLFVVIKQIGFTFPKFTHIREYLRFGLPSIPSNVSSWVMHLSDRYIIAFFFGVIAVGLYSPAYTLGDMLALLVAPFAFILTPFLSESYDNKKIDDVKKYIYYSLKYFLIIAIPAAFGLSVLSQPLLKILSNNEIASQASMITPLVSFSTVLYGLTVILSEIVYLVKKTSIIAKAWGLGAFLNIVLNLIIIPRYGIVGAAATTLFSYTVVYVIIYFASKKYLDYQFDSYGLAKSILISILFIPIVVILNPDSIGRLILTVLLCSVLYVSLSYLLRVFDKNELKFIKNLVYQNRTTD